jgi:hypothetical protein
MSGSRWMLGLIGIMLATAYVVCAEEGMSAGATAATEAAQIVVGGAIGQVVSLTAEVVAIDQAKREATIRLPGGKEETIAVSKEAYNFDQVEVGDVVNVDLMESVALFVDAVPADPSSSSGSALARAPQGQKPEGVAASHEDVTATVTEIDYQTRNISLLGPRGNTLTLNVPADAAPNFDKIKKGDTVVARYTVALALKIEPAHATAPSAEPAAKP